MHLSYLDRSYIILSMKISQKWQDFFFFLVSSLAEPFTVKKCSNIGARIRHFEANLFYKQSSGESTFYQWTKTGSTFMPATKEGEFMRVWMGNGKFKEQSLKKGATVHKTSG